MHSPTMLLTLPSFAASLVALGCSSGSSKPAPVISDLLVTSPVSPSGSTTTVSGSLDASDSAGLSNVTLNFTLAEANGATLGSTSSAVQGADGQGMATVPFTVILEAAVPAGSYVVDITLTEGGATSNELTADLVIN